MCIYDSKGKGTGCCAHETREVKLLGCFLCRTITDHVKFVPYGLSVNDDASRIQYMTDMKGYCKTILLPCFDLYEETQGSLPKHLTEVQPLIKMSVFIQ